MKFFTETLARLDAQEDAYVDAVVRLVRVTLDEPKRGTMKAWMQAHDGLVVSTIQVDNRSGASWCPTGRTVDARKASSVELSGSMREYRGMRVLHASRDVLIVADDWHTIAYIVETAAMHASIDH